MQAYAKERSLSGSFILPDTPYHEEYPDTESGKQNRFDKNRHPYPAVIVFESAYGEVGGFGIGIVSEAAFSVVVIVYSTLCATFCAQYMK